MLEVNIIRAHELHLDMNVLEAAQHILDGLKSKREQLDEGIRLLADLVQVAIFIRRKQYDEAEAALNHIEKLSASPSKRWFTPLVYLRWTELELSRNALDLARKYAYQALGAIGCLGDLRYLTTVYCLLAEIMILKEEDPEAIDDALDRAIKTAREQGRKLHRARAMLLIGYHMQQTSHRYKTRARANTYRFEAAQLYREMGLPIPEKIATYEIAGSQAKTQKAEKESRFTAARR
jgi:tetratricopeptide (TPR) repeat protein